MRTRPTAATGAALLYILTAGATLACPTASDLDGAGIRFVGADGGDEIHRRLDAQRIEIEYEVDGAPLSRSILGHGVYLVWYGDVDASGAIIEGTGTTFVRAGKLADLPVPQPGLAWNGAHTLIDSTGTYEETNAMTVAAAEPWVLGDCTLQALPVTLVVSGSRGPNYTETMMYLPDFGTAVLMGFSDPDGSTNYEYTAVRAEAE